ncbi:hypothetical protein NECAME_09042 [Necator americanus]|uniref:Uncharacterized protein n=1 Tax=Necator americanus TaxID=51031 RepID=W2TF14_NECAM|nr:hypothetical protein NECAME_09042 [Necator americanus]ETN80650.1 hypothetical protein NECAME_09042 [Necator americanus]
MLEETPTCLDKATVFLSAINIFAVVWTAFCGMVSIKLRFELTDFTITINVAPYLELTFLIQHKYQILRPSVMCSFAAAMEIAATEATKHNYAGYSVGLRYRTSTEEKEAWCSDSPHPDIWGIIWSIE